MRTRTTTSALISVLLGVVLTVVYVVPTHSATATIPPNFEDVLVTRLARPTAFDFAPGNRVLITTQPGTLRVYHNGVLLTTPALDLTGKVCANKDRGLMGVTVDPAFATNHFVYLYYTFNKFGVCEQNTRTRRSTASRALSCPLVGRLAGILPLFTVC